MSEPILVIKDLDKSFPGVHALDHVSLEVRPHEVVGLIGENGAGKSTVLKVLAGLYAPNSGTVTLRGKRVAYRTISASPRSRKTPRRLWSTSPRFHSSPRSECAP